MELLNKFIEFIEKYLGWKLVLGFLSGVLLIAFLAYYKLTILGITILDCRETNEIKQLTSVAQKIYFDYIDDQLKQAENEYKVYDFKGSARIYYEISQDCEKNICNKIKLKINSSILEDATKSFEKQDWQKSCDKFKSFFSTLTGEISHGN